MKQFRLGEWKSAGKRLKKTFGNEIILDKAIDPLMSRINGYITVDVLYIEEFLTEHGLSDSESMEDFVISRYGKDAAILLKTML